MSSHKSNLPEAWAHLSTAKRIGIVALAAFEVVATTVALADLARRPRELVRGPKVMWALACVVQPVGPVAYLVAGRIGPDDRTPQPEEEGPPEEVSPGGDDAGTPLVAAMGSRSATQEPEE